MTDGGLDDDGTSLPEPARQQLLVLADAVLASLSGDEVPAVLRPIANFTPSRRLRLGATALAGALDGDESFRERVAAAAETAASDLADAVRHGVADRQLAADPLDVAVLAYLLRPDGWEGAVGAAARRWRDGTAAAATAEVSEELTRLRSQVAELRTAARGEPDRVSEAVRAATAESADELATLRKAVRDRTRELRAAERERDTARSEAAAAGATADERLTDRDEVHRAEVQRLREQVAEAGAAAQAARRAGRAERDHDDARLWLLVDTLVQAAAGVRRELSLAAPDVRPADGVAASETGGGGQRVADPAALDGLFALPHVHVIVDGYNVTKSGYGELTLIEQRTRLATSLAALTARTGAEITVVWDGAHRPPVQPPAPRGVRVLFSAADEIADDLIRRLVAAEPVGRPVLVVTSDRQIVHDTARAGVWAVPSAVLLARLG